MDAVVGMKGVTHGAWMVWQNGGSMVCGKFAIADEL